MNMRKVTSLTALLSFLLLMVTSIVLYIVPAGRVAYWSNWQLWGMTKDQWGAVHINLGFLFFIAIVLHTYYNWQAVMSYMKNKARQFRMFTLDFNISVVVTLVVFFGTLAGIPPMSTVIDLGATISEKANLAYGEPPYGHAELSPLADFVYKVKADLEASIAKLESASIHVVDNNEPVGELAERSGVSPQRIYEIIKPPSVGGAAAMPEEAPGGTGQRKLSVLCSMYKLDVMTVVSGLAAQGITATPEQTIKEIAVAAGQDPHGVYALIYQLSLK